MAKYPPKFGGIIPAGMGIDMTSKTVRDIMLKADAAFKAKDLGTLRKLADRANNYHMKTGKDPMLYKILAALVEHTKEVLKKNPRILGLAKTIIKAKGLK